MRTEGWNSGSSLINPDARSTRISKMPDKQRMVLIIYYNYKTIMK